MKDVFAPNGGMFLARLAEYVSGKGHDFSSLVREQLSIPEALDDPAQALPVHEHSLAFEVAERICADPLIGYSLAHHCTLRDAGLVGYAVGASATVGEALRTLTSLSGVFEVANVELSPGSGTGQVELRWDYGSQGKLDLRHWSEFTAALLVRNLNKLTRGTVAPVAVDFMHIPLSQARNLDIRLWTEAGLSGALQSFGVSPTGFATAVGECRRRVATPFDGARGASASGA